MQKYLIILAAAFGLLAGSALAVPADSSEDEDKNDGGTYNCTVMPDGDRVCACHDIISCNRMDDDGVCKITAWGETLYDDTNCEVDGNTGEGSCLCTWQQMEAPGTSERPDQENPSTENAPTDDVSSTDTPAIFAAPTDLSISNAGGNTLRFTWQDNSNNERGFVIERLLPMTSAWATIATVDGAGSDMGQRSHTIIIEGARISFCYRVRATRGSITTAPTERACAGLD